MWEPEQSSLKIKDLPAKPTPKVWQSNCNREGVTRWKLPRKRYSRSCVGMMLPGSERREFIETGTRSAERDGKIRTLPHRRICNEDTFPDRAAVSRHDDGTGYGAANFVNPEFKFAAACGDPDADPVERRH